MSFDLVQKLTLSRRGKRNAATLINHFVQNWESNRRNLLQKKRGQLTREIGLLKIIVSLNIKVGIFRTYSGKKKNCRTLRMRCKNTFVSTSGHYVSQPQ